MFYKVKLNTAYVIASEKKDANPVQRKVAVK